MRIIVLQKDHRLDSSAAEEFGSRTYVLTNFVDPFNTDKLIHTLKRKLKQIRFDPDTDVICLTGPSILLQIFLAVVGHQTDRIRVLMFYAPDGKYRLRVLELKDGTAKE